MLFEKFSLRGVEFKNRIFMAPMCMYMAGEDAAATDWHYIHYATRAQGGAALVMLEAIAVSPEGRITSQDLGLYDEAHLPGLARIVDEIHRMGAKAGVQLAHAGRKGLSNVPAIYAPSAIAYDDESPTPVAADEAYIEKTVGDFRAAAERAARVGFDLAQLHGAHGYFQGEWLSPLTNKRSDAYGGPAENRVRVLGATLEAIRSVWPDEKPLGVRVSAEEYEEGGLHPEDVAALLNLVKGKGLDYVDVSSGGVTPFVPKASPGYQIPYAKTVKDLTDLPVAGGGLITTPQAAEDVVASGSADCVYLGRELLRNPYFPLCASVALGVDVPWPTAYERAKPRR
ncbi:MAG: NADPH dehydrogenase [Clostridiales Family XIII bacterium]|jgi:NADPH2 dehydrogenase|nr:NADPH dehydrogenase [Clostridiales Family XIII bacterium]